MAFNRIKDLLEVKLTKDNLRQHSGASVDHLTGTDEFKAIAELEPALAKKLETAWTGDANAYKKSHGRKTDFLLPTYLTKAALTRFFPNLQQTPEVITNLALLLKLHQASFPEVTGNVDNSVWSSEKWAKEAEEFDSSEYDILREEVKEYLAEFKESESKI